MNPITPIDQAPDESLEMMDLDRPFGSNFILLLERLFKISALYPPGHIHCDQVAADFQAELKELLGEGKILRLHFSGGVLFLQDQALDDDLRGIRNFREMHEPLGVSRVEFSVGVTPDDLHNYVRLMFDYRNKVKGSRQFQQVEIEGMPETILTDQREFVRDTRLAQLENEEDQDGDNQVDQVTAFLHRLDQQNLDPEHLSLFKQKLDNLLAQLEKNPESAPSPSPPPSGQQDLPELPPRASMPLGAGSFQIPDGDKLATEMSLDKLIGLLDQTVQDGLPINPTDSFKVLIGILKQAGPKKTTDKTAVVTPQVDGKINYEISLAELKDKIAAAEEEADLDLNLFSRDRCETISIYMMMLGEKHTPRVWSRLREELADVLAEKISPLEHEILVGGLTRVLDQEDDKAKAQALIMVMELLRETDSAAPLLVIRDVCKKCSATQLISAWPFAVNEILRGRKQQDPAVYRELCDLVMSLSEDDIQDQVKMLKYLPTVRSSQVCEDLFIPPIIQLFPLYAALLRSTHLGNIGEMIVEGLKLNSPGWIGDAIMPLVDRYHFFFRDFLVELLTHRDQKNPATAMLEEAGKVLEKRLLMMPAKRRSEDWAPATIALIPRFTLKNPETLLNNIIKTRKAFWIKEWPAACRKAAKEALAQVQAQASQQAANKGEESSHGPQS